MLSEGASIGAGFLRTIPGKSSRTSSLCFRTHFAHFLFFPTPMFIVYTQIGDPPDMRQPLGNPEIKIIIIIMSSRL